MASGTGDTSTGRWLASARAWTKVGLALMPPSTRSVGDRDAAVGLGRLDQVGAPVGDALEHGPHDLGPARAPGEAEQGAAGAVVPVRRAQAEQGGDEARRSPVSSHCGRHVVATRRRSR